MSTTIGLLCPYVALTTMASLIIWTGAYASLKPPPKSPRSGGADNNDEESDSDDEPESEVINSSMALMYPLVGSVALVTLYGAIKYFGPEAFNYVLSIVFGVAGIGSIYATCAAFVRAVTPANTYRNIPRYRMVLFKRSKEIVSWKFSTTSLLLLPLSLVPPIAYYVLREKDPLQGALWTVVLSVSFAFNALKQFKLDSFRTGTYLLAGLFFYDVWWVFGTEVMVSVAKGADLPIKLLFPRTAHVTSSKDFMMLGLGDVVVPGLFIALALRYDQARHLASVSTPVPPTARTNFSKQYFNASIISYVLGLATTMAVMHFTRQAQPALLYLSPACILSFVFVAVARGELSEALNWQDDDGDSQHLDANQQSDRLLRASDSDETDLSVPAAGGMGGVANQNITDKKNE